MSILKWLNPFNFADNVAGLGDKIDSYMPTLSNVATVGPQLLFGGIRYVWDSAVNAVTGKGKAGEAAATADASAGAGEGYDMDSPPHHGLPGGARGAGTRHR